MTPVQRLATTNLLGRDGMDKSNMKERDYLSRLVKVPEPEQRVELSLGPSEGVETIELDVHRSVSGLSSQPPLKSVECQEACGPWYSEVDTGRRLIRLPADEVSSGNVLVVNVFVQLPREVGSVSWGMVIGAGTN